MKVNWDRGFARIRWAFLAVSWLIFIIVNVADDASAARWGENSVYMLFFTGGAVLLARACIWIVRGFFSDGGEVSR